MRIKKFLEEIDFTRVLVVSIGYIVYIAFALYKKMGNETINIILISATFLYLLMFIFIGNNEEERENVHVRRKTKNIYKWVKRSIHLINALYIVISILFYEEEATPFTILFKYITIVNFAVQLLASLFRFILKKKVEKMMSNRKHNRMRGRNKVKAVKRMEYKVIYGSLDEIKVKYKKEITSKEELHKAIKEAIRLQVKNMAFYVDSLYEKEITYQQYIEMVLQNFKRKEVLVLFVTNPPVKMKTNYQENIQKLLHLKVRRSNKNEMIPIVANETFSDVFCFFLQEKEQNEQEICIKSFLHPEKLTSVNKNNIWALSIALKLNHLEIQRFLASKNYSYLQHSRKDIILNFLLKKKIYNFSEIEAYLYYFNCDSLIF